MQASTVGRGGRDADAVIVPFPFRPTAAMVPITAEQLSEIIVRLDARTEKDAEGVLTDLLVTPYPTRLTQDN